MKVLVFGASGNLGSRIVRAALDRDHTVTAFLRDPTKMPLQNDRLDLLAGDALDAATVAGAIPGHDAVINAMGAGASQGDLEVLSQGIRNVVTGMQQNGVRRLISVANGGILQADEKHMRRDMPFYPAFQKPVSAGHLEAFNLLRTTDLDWTLICPPTMEADAPTGTFRTRVDYLPDGGRQIAFDDVANFVVQVLDSGEYVHKRVGVCY